MLAVLERKENEGSNQARAQFLKKSTLYIAAVEFIYLPD